MGEKMTRRELATILVTAPVAVAQTQPAAVDDQQAARDQIRRNAEALTRVALPMTTEPAFQFKP